MSEWTDEQVREMEARRAAWEYAALRAATPALVPTPCVVSCQWEGYAEYESMEKNAAGVDKVTVGRYEKWDVGVKTVSAASRTVTLPESPYKVTGVERTGPMGIRVEYERLDGVINNRRSDEMGNDYGSGMNQVTCDQVPKRAAPKTVGEVLDERVRHHQGEAERLGTLRVRLKDVLSMDVSALGELLSRVY